MKLRNSELILNLTEPVLWEVFGVNAHLCCLTLQDTLVMSVVGETVEPIRAGQG